MEFLSANLAAIFSSLFGGVSVLGWFFERRKNKAQVDKVEIGNLTVIIDKYKSSLDDLAIRYERKYNELIEDCTAQVLLIEQSCDRKVKALEDEIKIHKRRYTLIKKENTELRAQIKNEQK